MDAYLKKMLARVTAFWGKLSKTVKIMIVGGLVAVVLIAVILNAVFNVTKYTVLYSGLSDQESGQIVTQLKSMGVRYKISGSEISVDSSKAAETRMQLAENGYPQSTNQYTLYTSGNSWAQTDSDKKVLQLYQLQTTLEQTINTIPGVTSSVVNIVENTDDTYVLDSDKVSPTASVKLNLSPGVTLSKKQVNGIVLLVSHSVSNLSADNVTVLDSDGTPLTDSSDGLSGNTSDQIELKNSVENEIRQKVLSVLNPVFGSGNVQVAAGATLDFSQKTTNTTTYSTPQNSSSGVGLPSSQTTSATVSGSTGASGVAGVNSGIPNYPTTSGGSGGAVTQSSTQTSYLYDTVNQQIQSQGGTMTGLTIAVLLNSKNQNTAAVNVNEVTQTVAYAVGLTNSQDISVALVPFASAAKTGTTPQASSFALNPLYLAAGGAGLLLVSILVVAILLLTRRKKRRRVAAAAEAGALPETVPAAPVGVKAPEVPDLKTIEDTIEESMSKNTVKRQIADFADDKPELVAQLLKNWLKD